MVKPGKTETGKEKFYAAKKPKKNWDVNVDNTVISKLAKTKSDSKYLIGYLDKDIRSLVLIIPNEVDMLRHLKLKIKTRN